MSLIKTMCLACERPWAQFPGEDTDRQTDTYTCKCKYAFYYV